MYFVRVLNGNKRKASYYKIRLTLFGLIRDADGSYYGKVSSYLEKKRLELFCKRKHLRFCLDNELSFRSLDYRKNFFSSNNPVIGNRYICAYCGRLFKKEKITVDHLYPIGKAKESIILQKWLHFIGINNINDVRNLVPACEICNKKKGKKTGVWIIRGVLGRSNLLWATRWLIRVFLVGFLLYYIYLHLSFYGIKLF